MQEIIAYEMSYNDKFVSKSNISCGPFNKEYFAEYIAVYNACFYEMRQALNIEPYNFYSEYSQVSKKEDNIFVLMDKGKIIGSVACYGNEIDDLIVDKAFQNQGYGRQLLLWGMQYIRRNNDEPITLHVAEWNNKALELYKKVGFVVTKREKVR